MNRIALIIPGLDRIGGAERQLILLAKGLRKRGWQVSVVALSGTGGAAATELASHQIQFTSLGMRKGLADPRGWIRFHRWLRRERPDVVHAHLPHASWFARWSRLALPIRVMVDTLHSSSTGTLGRRLGYRCSAWLPDKVTAVSHAVAGTHLAAAMVGEDKLIVLPNGVDVEEWRPDPLVRSEVRCELEVNAEFLWFAAGRLDPVKDYPTLLRAMAEVREPARLVIAGAGPLESELRRLSRDLGLESRVRFLGFQPDVRRWMQAADGFVVTSPEWHGMVPAGLKNFFLYCSPKEVGHKPALITAVSAMRGGAYPVQELRISSYKNSMICYIPEHLIIRQAASIFQGETPSGKDDEYLRGRADHALRVLIAYTKAFKPMRESGVVFDKKYPNGM